MASEPPSRDSIFCRAIEIPSAPERARYIARACGEDAELRRGVEKLVEAHFRAGSFLQQPAGAAHTGGYSPPAGEPPALREGVGTVIGPYKLLEGIGEGGFGVVFMAEQSHPIRRKVALKVIKPGMDSKQVIARFEAERQALALMDHPHIAHVLDAGETAAGRPYFVMELVRGIPLTDFCDQANLTVPERLGLFVSICQAVQHAHTKGIIHRDLKPSNVLVTLHDGEPVPKVIDFGIAKAAGRQLTDKTLFTGFAQMIGTPLYMSPEQAGLSALDVDTRSDIYSLGVLLYELLTGTTPFDSERLRQADFDELRRIIREEEPPRPSRRISTLGQAGTTVSAHRKSEPGKLAALFRGELDWVVMKCLEKDRNRRYETASALALDLRRYLADEPVQACPPSAGYRLRKFARRNRSALAVVALALCFLVVLGAGAGWVVRDRGARKAALEIEAAAALDEAENWYRGRRLSEAMAAVKRAESLLAGGGGSEGLRERAAQSRAALEMVARLEEIRVARAGAGPAGRDRKEVVAEAYAKAYRQYGIDPASGDAGRWGAQVRTSWVRDALTAGLDDWAQCTADPAGRARLIDLARQADPDPVRVRIREAYQRQDGAALKALAQDGQVLAQPAATVLLLANGLRQMRQVPPTVELLRKAQPRHASDYWVNLELVRALLAAGRWREAAPFFRTAIALRPDDPSLHYEFGALFWPQDPVGAEASLREAIRLRPDHAGYHLSLAGRLADDPGRLGEAEVEAREAVRLQPEAFAHQVLARILARAGKLADAEGAYREAIRLRPAEDAARVDLGRLLGFQQKRAEAEAVFRDLVRVKPTLHWGHYLLGDTLRVQGKQAEASEAFREAARLAEYSLQRHFYLGNTLRAEGKPDEAAAEYRKSIAEDGQWEHHHYQLANLLAEQNKLDEAAEEYRAVLRFNPGYAEASYGLGHVLGKKGDHAGAEEAYRKAVAQDPKHPVFHRALGLVLVPQGKLAEAEGAFREALRLRPNYGRAHHNLGDVLARQGKWPDAVAAFEQAVRHQPKDPESHAELARLLANRPDETNRDPERAVAEAEQAVGLAPKSARAWQILGWARYRVGQYAGCIEALEKSITLQTKPKGGGPGQWLFLAMAHWQTGDRDEARRWYDRAAARMDRRADGNEELGRVRGEAAALLKIGPGPTAAPTSK